MTTEREIAARIAEKMADPIEAPPPKKADFLSYNDSLDSFQKYAKPDSELSAALNAVVEQITVDEAIHAEAFICEVFGISEAEHTIMVEWTRAGAEGEPPAAVVKLAQPITADLRLAKIIQKYDMHANPSRLWVLQRLFSRMTELNLNSKLAGNE